MPESRFSDEEFKLITLPLPVRRGEHRKGDLGSPDQLFALEIETGSSSGRYKGSRNEDSRLARTSRVCEVRKQGSQSVSDGFAVWALPIGQIP